MRIQIAIYGMPIAMYVETVSAMPRFNDKTGRRDISPGITSMLTAGRNGGIFEGIAAALMVPYVEVAAATWKKAMSCPGDKDASRALACKLFPPHVHAFSFKTKHGRAEAAMIGLWGHRFGLVRSLVP